MGNEQQILQLQRQTQQIRQLDSRFNQYKWFW